MVALIQSAFSLAFHVLEQQSAKPANAWTVPCKHMRTDRPSVSLSRSRAQVREASVRWDCGQRVRRAAQRKAAPVTGPHQVGDSFRTAEKRKRVSMDCNVAKDVI